MDETPVGLDICTELFDEFHEQEIRYCHWKSNEHLQEGLVGETDLDVIVERTQEVDKWRISVGSGTPTRSRGCNGVSYRAF